ncbi:20203_t:CDS:1, partial [Gigaspora rosea]
CHFTFWAIYKPSEKKLKVACQKLPDPNDTQINYILPKNANSTEKAKYELCQDISHYQRENNLPDQELAQKLWFYMEPV